MSLQIVGAVGLITDFYLHTRLTVFDKKTIALKVLELKTYILLKIKVCIIGLERGGFVLQP